LEPEERMELSLSDLAEERLLLGLRTHAGVELQELQGEFNVKINAAQKHLLEQWVSQGLIERAAWKKNTVQLRATARGFTDHLAHQLITRNLNWEA
ncbi:hypothetical protein RZS08_03765, partial [Arthrospira platensis SPKY1]|nr:hypothetical protein [Arthrospira platensis SPKY1]